MGKEESLLRDCEKVTPKAAEFIWRSADMERYEVADAIFHEVASTPSLLLENEALPTRLIWFPAIDSNTASAAEIIANIISSNSLVLGGASAKFSTWPSTPATCVELNWNNLIVEEEDIAALSETELSRAIAATEQWVDGTLGRLRLCPHTASKQRSATGLESIGVKEGPVGVRHTLSLPIPPSTAPAAALCTAFWKGVVELATTPEDNLATLLVVAPPVYDDDLVGFISACDNILEASGKAVGADEIIGKAWFHPSYDSRALKDNKEVLPGHVVPATMVQKFVDRYLEDNEVCPDLSTIAMANDKVRHSPHATINLLRRSQLRAAKELEQASPVKRPNAVYARNVMRILSQKE